MSKFGHCITSLRFKKKEKRKRGKKKRKRESKQRKKDTHATGLIGLAKSKAYLSKA